MMQNDAEAAVQVDISPHVTVREIAVASLSTFKTRVVRDVPNCRKRAVTELRMVDHGVGFFRCRCTGCPKLCHVRIRIPNWLVGIFFHLPRRPIHLTLNDTHALSGFSSSESILLRPASVITLDLKPDASMHEVIILIKPTLIESWFSVDERRIPRHLESVSEERMPGSVRLIGATTPLMSFVLRRLVTCKMNGGLARVFREATIHELVAMRLAQIEQEPRMQPVIALTRRDLEKLEKAHHVLCLAYRDPPTIANLARTVGLNGTKLKAGFKHRFGTTIFRYIRSLRLNRAFMMLQDGSYNVTETAALVGYQSLSAFTAAFRKEYGVPPRMVRGKRFTTEVPGQSDCSQPSASCRPNTKYASVPSVQRSSRSSVYHHRSES